jgi:type IV secretory pathway VirB4 component
MAESDKYSIVGDYLAIETGGCTCGAGGVGYPHEPSCGLEPVAKLTDIDRNAIRLSHYYSALLEIVEGNLEPGSVTVRAQRALDEAKEALRQNGLLEDES